MCFNFKHIQVHFAFWNRNKIIFINVLNYLKVIHFIVFEYLEAHLKKNIIKSNRNENLNIIWSVLKETSMCMQMLSILSYNQ